MATSEVKRIIEPNKPGFKKGTLLIAPSGMVVMCDGGEASLTFSGIVMHAVYMYLVGDTSKDWAKNSFKPFKGSVTLTEA